MKLTVALLALLLLPATAVASADGQLWEEVKVAENYWAAQGFTTTCPAVSADIAPVPDSVDAVLAAQAGGWAYLNSCALAITPDVAVLTRKPNTDVFDLMRECGTTVHEYGHAALGLTHDDASRFPVMAESRWDEDNPRACFTWARKIKRERRQALRLRHAKKRHQSSAP